MDDDNAKYLEAETCRINIQLLEQHKRTLFGNINEDSLISPVSECTENSQSLLYEAFDNVIDAYAKHLVSIS